MKDEFTALFTVVAMFILFGMTRAYNSKIPVSWKAAPTKFEAVYITKPHWKKFIPNNK